MFINIIKIHNKVMWDRQYFIEYYVIHIYYTLMIFCRIMSIPRNIVMDLNNVIFGGTDIMSRNIPDIMFPDIMRSPNVGSECGEYFANDCRSHQTLLRILTMLCFAHWMVIYDHLILCWLLGLEWLAYYKHSAISFSTRVILVFVLGSMVKHIPLKSRCPIKSIRWVRPTYLN